MYDLKTLIDSIEKNPLYHFSRSNTELFHSNFWYWLSTIDEKETLLLFDPSVADDIKENQGIKFEREKEHLDLTIETDNIIYVIENKIKSIARNTQLDLYHKKITNKKSKNNKSEKNIKFILISPHDYEYLGQKDWKLIKYRDLSERLSRFTIKNIYPEEKLLFYNKLINSYSLLLNNISDIIDYFSQYNVDNSYYFYTIPENEKKELECIKMYDIIMKIGAAKCAFNLYEKIKKDSRFNNYIIEDFNTHRNPGFENYRGNNIFINYGYSTNKGPIIDIYFPFNYYILKIQIEGNSYKYVFQHYNKNIFKKFKELSKYLLNNNKWITKDLKGEGRDKSGVNKYNDKEYGENFHYKYKEINKEISYNLLEFIINDIYKALTEIKPLITKLI